MTNNGKQIMTPKDVHILISKAYKYNTFLAKRDFTGVMRIRILTWGNEIILDYLGGSNVVTGLS
jgi:hypothetical protein